MILIPLRILMFFFHLLLIMPHLFHYMTNSHVRLCPAQIKNVFQFSQLYAKSKIPTDELLDKGPPDYIKLRGKILGNHHKVF